MLCSAYASALAARYHCTSFSASCQPLRYMASRLCLSLVRVDMPSAVGRNDAPCARLLHSQGAAYLFVVAPGPLGKAHINDAKSHPIRPPACVFHHSISPLLKIRIRQLVVFAEK